MSNDFKAYDEHEDKRKEINERAAKEFQENGGLSGATLLNESYELDGDLNKQLLEKRIAQHWPLPKLQGDG